MAAKDWPRQRLFPPRQLSVSTACPIRTTNTPLLALLVGGERRGCYTFGAEEGAALACALAEGARALLADCHDGPTSERRACTSLDAMVGVSFSRRTGAEAKVSSCWHTRDAWALPRL